MASPERDKEGFTVVDRKRRKERKAEHSRVARPVLLELQLAPANGHFNWLISEHQSVNLSREAVSILSGKYKRFTFVHPVASY